MGNENTSDLVDGYFEIHLRRKKREESLSSEPSIIKNGIYYPNSPYVLINGFGGKYKGKTMEWIFQKHPDFFFDMFYWAKYAEKRPRPDNPFCLRIDWIIKSFQLSPRCRCSTIGCEKEASYFSTRKSGRGIYSFCSAYTACTDHKNLLNPLDEYNVKLHDLSFDSQDFFESKKDKKAFFIFLHGCFSFEKLTKKVFFHRLQSFLPAVKIELEQPLQIQNKKVVNDLIQLQFNF